MKFEKKLLVIGSVSESYRKYILDEIIKKGIDIVLITDKKVSFENQLTKNIIFANTLNADEMYARVQLFYEKKDFIGIFTYDENAIESTALLAQKLELTFTDPDVAKACRNKYIMRSKLEEASLLVPKYQRIKTIEEVKEFLKRIDGCAVIKPILGWGSIGVTKIDNNSNVEKVFSKLRMLKIRDNYLDEFIIEEYISGKEYSVESIVCNGQVHHYGITEKVKGEEPYFEEIGHKFPALLSQKTEEEILAVVKKAVMALGINIGATHSEIIVSSRGYFIVEIANRLGGDKIPFLVYLATEKNMASDAIDVAIGKEIKVCANKSMGAAIKFLIPEKEGYLLKCPVVESKWINKNVIECIMKGDVKKIRLPPHEFYTRLGYVITIGEDSDSAYKLAEKIIKSIELKIDDSAI